MKKFVLEVETALSSITSPTTIVTYEGDGDGDGDAAVTGEWLSGTSSALKIVETTKAEIGDEWEHWLNDCRAAKPAKTSLHRFRSFTSYDSEVWAKPHIRRRDGNPDAFSEDSVSRASVDSKSSRDMYV
eukprot:Filipodium_phascolosomae@DN3085_c0_g1_i1.p1